MTLDLERFRFFENSTIGKLAINGDFYCYTLEKPINYTLRYTQGAFAIPFGRYRVIVTRNGRYDYFLPLLIRVPGFSDVRIQRGNFPNESNGSILVGLDWRKDYVGITIPTEIQLTNKIMKLEVGETTIINIRNVMPIEDYTNSIIVG